jgi:hypothetical protein
MQTGRLTESYMERDLHIGKGAFADRQAYRELHGEGSAYR